MDLNIRAGYGETGSEAGVSAHDYLDGYDFKNGSAVLDGSYVIGLRPRGIPVRNLSWVTNTMSNIGIDATFLNKRLTLTADVFQRKRTGLPTARYDVVLPMETGYILPNENLNSDAHRGVEGIVNYSDKAGDFSYSVGANATLSRLMTLDSYKPRSANSWDEYRNSKEQRWANIEWGYQIEGRFQSKDEINNYPVNIDGQGNRTLLPGDFIYKDVNGDGIINNLDERPIGYARGGQPYLSYGLNLGLEWKGISFTADFAGADMQTWRRNVESKIPFQNDGSAFHYLFDDAWHQQDPYDNNSPWIPGTYPAVRRGASHSNMNKTNDFWNVNVRYFRLKTLELGYTLPSKMSAKIGASKVRVYVNATNLFSFDNVKQFEIDPEIAMESALVYPLQRLTLVGFNLSF